MNRCTFTAMGTTMIAHTDDPDGVRAAVEGFEATFSRFRPDSELQRLNAHGASGIRVSPAMLDVLRAAEAARTRTGGLVDVGMGAAMEAWGYDVSFPDMTQRRVSPDAVAPPEWSLHDDVVRVGPGTKIDLGGIAKGWTCDRIVESGLATIMSAGGDLRSVDPALVVDIEDEPGDVVAEVPVGVGALATSSTTRRRWRVGDVEAHHLMDPTTGRPAVTPIRTASVVADTAVEAETAAKAVLLLGADGLAWADRQPWIRRALVVWHDGSVYATSEDRAA